jgi:subtilisin family serine protease
VDVFAPGQQITSASYQSDTATAVMSGTSMASPHVAGAAALVLGANPKLTPKQVRDALVNNATADKVISAGSGSPNKLLYTGFLGTPATNGAIGTK